jgi:ubiquinone/menaquinone biosynthesis C-methylase UbiE
MRVLTPAIFLLLLTFGQLPVFCQHRDPLEYIRILESADRVRKLQVDRVIESLRVQPGQKIADVGSGSGLFTRPLARQVGDDGIVYAVDIDESLLRHIEVSAQSQNLSNIKTVPAGELDPKIPEKVDLILICDTLHQIDNPDIYLRGLTRYLAPSGRVAVIDYEKNWPERFESVKYSTSQLNQWMKAAGYRLKERFEFLDDNFFVVYEYTNPTGN